MRFGKISLAALAVATLVTAPVVAQANVAAAKVERANAARKQENKLGGSILLALLSLGAVVAGIIVATGNNDDLPTSP